jgi:NAD(P)-dependent dehydrogenase (short-subunit alcohol dehydrogenase family)
MISGSEMVTRLDGKSALVTGAGGGFGKACALLLARDGAAVTLMGRTQATLEASRDLILGEAPEAKVAIFVGDSTDAGQMEKAVEATVAHGGGIDIVLAIVGGGGYGMVDTLELDTFMNELKMNVGSALLAVRYAVPKMANGGSFVFVSSTAAKMAFVGLSSYCAGKAALDQFMRVAANELGKRQIRLNCVRPGLTHTDGMDALFHMEGYVEGFLPLIPVGRAGVPMDVARAVRFLADPASSWITGQSFAVDGGNELRGAPMPPT